MGILSILQKLKQSGEQFKIVILGLENSGKTTLLKHLGEDCVSHAKVTPTQGFNTKSIQRGHSTLNMWDIGGQRTIRLYWRNYLGCTNAIIFVIDCSDKTRLFEANSELQHLLDEDKLEGEKDVELLARYQHVYSAPTSFAPC